MSGAAFEPLVMMSHYKTEVSFEEEMGVQRAEKKDPWFARVLDRINRTLVIITTEVPSSSYESGADFTQSMNEPPVKAMVSGNLKLLRSSR